MGRAFKFTEVSRKNYTKDELEIKKVQEESLATFEPLDFSIISPALSADAKKEWERLSKVIDGLPISELDRTTIENICMYTAIIKKAQRQLKSAEYIIDGRPNPIFKIINDTSKELRALANMSGLSIDSRLRIKNPTTTNEPEDPYEKMFKNK